jgi:tetratricopeptide (TPR) repeat protein
MTVADADDEQYLTRLKHALRSGSHKVRQQELSRLTPETLEPTMASAGMPDDMRKHVIEGFDGHVRELAALYDGPFISAMHDMAVKALGPDAERVGDVYVRILPTDSINAQVFTAPSGRRVIALNEGILLAAPLAFHCAWELTNGRLEFVDAARGLHALAIFSRTGDVDALGSSPAAFAGLNPWARGPVNIAIDIEVFQLLHEFGHVVRDLDQSVSDRRAPSSQHDVELAADLYAIDCLRASRDDAQRVFWSVALLLRFCSLCELVWDDAPSVTHPSPGARWAAIKRSLNATGECVDMAMADEVDRIFDATEELMREIRRAADRSREKLLAKLGLDQPVLANTELSPGDGLEDTVTSRVRELLGKLSFRTSASSEGPAKPTAIVGEISVLLDIGYFASLHGDPAAAVEWLQPIVDRPLSPEFVHRGWLQLATALERADRFEEAEQLLVNAMASAEGAIEADILYELGIVYLRADRDADAVVPMKRAAAAYTRDGRDWKAGNAHLALAQVAAERGDQPAARDEALAAQSLYAVDGRPLTPEVADVLDRLLAIEADSPRPAPEPL